jgi:large subunit ribosomal protein L1
MVFATAKQVSKERKCKESFEVIVQMNVNPTKSDQNIRGTCVLPAGLGNVIRLCVFAGDEFHKQIAALGVEQIGNEAVLKDIGEGKVVFDKIIAT